MSRHEDAKMTTPRIEASRWFEQSWPVIEKNMAARRRTRSQESPKAHFETVVHLLADRFGDLDLCKAGALHGIEVDRLDSLELADPVEPGVVELLMERAQLRSLEGKPDMVDRLASYVLPEIRDLRSVLLLIFEQLCHFDPHDEMAAWSRAFFRQAPDASPDLPEPDGNFDSLETHLAFLSNVIAPMCDFLGFWREKWLARDLCLFHSDPDRFESIRRFVHESSRSGHVETRLGELRAALRAGTEGAEGPETTGHAENTIDVHWEWRPPSAIARSLVDPRPASSHKLIGRCGFVAVTCEDTTQCYWALGRLHERFNHRFGEIRDFIGEPAASGYKALHTELVSQEHNETVSVHIATKTSAFSRHDFTAQPHLDRLRDQVRDGKSFMIRVFTKDGQPLELPVGSCVLNFASKVHHDFVALARKATVNRKPVDLLHRLQPGDVVWLDIGDTPSYLPEGWEDRVPKNTVSQIRKEFRRCFRPALIKQGWRALRRRLTQKQPNSHRADEAMLRTAIGKADMILLEKTEAIKKRKGEEQWLRQLALLDTEIQGGRRMHRLEIDEAIAARFVDLVAAEIAKVPNVHRSTLDLPDEFHGKFDRIERRGISPRSKTMKGLLEDRTLVLLPASAAEGRTVHRITSLESPYYFVIECRHHLDAMPQILSTIQDHGGDILDVAANGMSVGWGVVRVHLRMLDGGSIETIREHLLELPEVGRITAPNEPEPPVAAANLPPRGSFSTDLTVDLPLPFRAGAPVRGEHFYGRETELQTLEQILKGRMSDDAGNGIVFVTGPLREGKSSLANEFIRRTRLQATLPTPLLSATVESSTNSCWSSVSEEMSHKLWRKAEERAGELGAISADRRTDDLRTTIERLQEETGSSLILVFDEVVKLISTIEKAGESEAFESFWAWASHRERLMVLFIGPLAPLKLMLEVGSDLARLLNSANRIQLRALDGQQTASLLQAEKQRPAIQIQAGSKILKRVFRLTGGQPMWVQLLAVEMFAIASQRTRSGQVTFSRNDCDLAYQHIAGTSQMRRSLEDRLFHAVEDSSRVLAVLEALIARPSDHQQGHDIEAIHRYLVRSQGVGDGDGDGDGFASRLDLVQLRDLLMELKDLGALDSKAPGRWQVASQFVQRFAEERLQTT